MSATYLVEFGKSGALGLFQAWDGELHRGQAVLVESPRGHEVGTIVAHADERKQRYLGAGVSQGALLRALTAQDRLQAQQCQQRAEDLYQACCRRIVAEALAVQLCDVDLLFEGSRAILQFVGDAAAADRLVHALEPHFQGVLELEDLGAQPAEPEVRGCGKPDCGKTSDHGCTSCSSGGCTSCGAGEVDLRAYFGERRTEMEQRHRRTALL